VSSCFWKVGGELRGGRWRRERWHTGSVLSCDVEGMVAERVFDIVHEVCYFLRRFVLGDGAEGFD
jgi:hypothetical protein